VVTTLYSKYDNSGLYGLYSGQIEQENVPTMPHLTLVTGSAR